MAVLGALAAAELAYRAVEHSLVAIGFWNWVSRRSEQNAEELAVEVWQEMEKDCAVRAVLKSQAATVYG